MAYTASSGAVIRIGVDGAEESRRQIESVATSMNRLSDTVSAAFKTLSSTIGLGSGLAGIIQMSDEYTKYTSQLRLATQTNTEYAASLEVVRRIAHDSQQALAGTGTLYARITNGTRELGISQQRVADVTEVVSLALKVSGATATESASAQLQLSQAFASGTLRGEEFNAVNEAAPRLMLALADGIGVPVGALKNMASNGLITSQVMADVLPKALAQLREESKQVQTIGGAFTVLKNNVLEFTAVQAQSNGTVAILTQGIGLLAENLGVLMNVVATVSVAKLASTISGWVAKTYEKIVADRLATTQTIALTQATVAETAAVLAAATARERELRAAVLAAEGHSILALTQNALIPAQARAAAAAQAHTAALAAQTAAAGAASVGGGILRGALGLLGGPIGAVVTVLGLAATAWSIFGSSSASASKTASENVRQSTAEIVEGLDKQIEKLRERNALAKAGISTTKNESAASVRLGEVVAELPKVAKGEGEYANLDLVARQAILQVLGREYGALTAKIEAFNTETSLAANGTRADQLAKWFGENGTNAQKLAAELERLKKQFGEIPPEMEKLVRAQYADKGAAAAINKEVTAYETLIASIKTKTEENRLELVVGTDATESQKTSIKITQELASGKLKLGSAHLEVVRAALAEQSASERLLKTQAAEKDVLAWIIQSTQARLASNDALAVEYQLFGKSAEAREIAMVSIKAEADLLKEIAEIEKKNGKLSEESIAQMRLEMGMRVEVTKAVLAQSKALGYAGQLKTENERFAAESIFDEKERAAALLAIDAKLWQERIALAGEGTEAQRLLQEQYVTWYANQTNKPMIDQWRESVKKYDDIFRQGFADMVNNGKSGWASFTKSLTTTFKTSVVDQIYKMFAQPFVMKLVASLLGVTSSGVASAAGSAAGSAGIGAGIAGTLGAIGSGALQTSGALLAGEIGFSSTLSAGFSAIASGTASGLTAGFASVVGALGPIALGIGAAVAIWKSMDTSGTIHTGGAASATASGVTNINAGSLGFQRINTTDAANALTAQLASGVVGILNGAATTFGKTAGYTAATAFADDTSRDGAWGALIISNLNGLVSQWGDASSRWAPKIFSDGEAGQKEYLASLSSSVRSALDDIGLPSWATQMLDGLGGSPALEDLAKAVSAITTTQAALVTLGQRLVGFAGLSDAATTALLSASGGIQALAANASTYYERFYSDGEKAAAVTKQLAASLSSVGLTLPATDAAYRALVESQIQLGEAGAKSVAILLANAGAFADLMESGKSAADTVDLVARKRELEIQIMEAAGDVFGAAAAKRSDELAAVIKATPELAALTRTLQSLAVAAEAKTVVDAYTSAGAAVTSSLSQVGDIVQGLKDKVASTAIGVKTAQDAISSAYFAAQDKVAQLQLAAAQSMANFSTSIRDFITGLTTASADSASSLSSLKAQFSSTATLAFAGDTKSQSALLAIGQKLLDTTRAGSSTSVDYSIQEAKLKVALGGIAGSIDKQNAASPFALALDPVVKGQQDLLAAQDRLLELASLAHVTGASTDISSQVTAGGVTALLAEYKSATAASLAAKSDYAVALALTSNLALTSTNSLTGLMSGLQSLSQSQSEFIKARNDLAAYIVNTEKNSGQLDSFAASMVKNLGLTGTAAADLTKLLADPGTAATTLATLLGSGALKVSTESTSLGKALGLGSTNVASFALGLAGVQGQLPSVVASLSGAGAQAEVLAGLLGPTKLGGAADRLTTTLGLAASAAQSMADLINGLKINPSGAAPSTGLPKELSASQAAVGTLYNEIFGRAADAAGLNFWADKLTSGALTMGNLAQSIAISAATASLDPAAQHNAGWTAAVAAADAAGGTNWLRAHNIPGFATGGDFAGGLRIVGENGPELEATGPSRVWNASQTRSMLGGSGDSDAIVAELRSLRTELAAAQRSLAALESSNRDIAGSTRTSKDLLADVIHGNRSINTTEVE